MSTKNDKLRIQRYRMADGREISVNTRYRFGVGYRATIKGEAGKFGESKDSPVEALGDLIMNWIVPKENTPQQVIGALFVQYALQEIN